MKKFLKVAVFLIIVIVACLFAQQKLGYRDALNTQNLFKDFYSLDKNTVDVVSTGTSAVQRGWLGPLAYNKYGISTYTIATASQPFCLTKNIMKEVEKTQNPKVFLIDIRAAIETPDNIKDSYIRRVTDNMLESSNRWNAIHTVLNFASKSEKNRQMIEEYKNSQDDDAKNKKKDFVDKSDISYYFRLAKYHDLFNPKKWPEAAEVEYYNGFAYLETSYYNLKEQEDVGVFTAKQELNIESKKVLQDLLDYCDSIKAETVFTLIPFSATVDEIKKINSAIEMIEKRGYKCINFLDEKHRKEIDVDFKKFFYNSRHTNYYGSEKYTTYMCEYLKKNYGLPDRRGDSKYRKVEKDSYLFAKKADSKIKKMYQEIERKK